MPDLVLDGDPIEYWSTWNSWEAIYPDGASGALLLVMGHFYRQSVWEKVGSGAQDKAAGRGLYTGASGEIPSSTTRTQRLTEGVRREVKFSGLTTWLQAGV